jgi:pimeloyl-ACP methyl ester carboxylesterase
MRSFIVRLGVLAITAVPLLCHTATAATAPAAPAANAQAKTVVLVHGAFSNASSWDKVIPLLQDKGLNVVAVQLPLSSLANDVAAVTRAINQQTGPVILVGHSWAGAVITQAGNNDKVAALVYVAAFVLDDGQSLGDLMKGLPPAPWAAALKADEGGFLTLTPDAIARYFAPDVPAAQAKVLAATQGPLFSGSMTEKVTRAAWHSKPSYYVLSEQDQIIDSRLQQTLATKIKATVTRVPSSHVAMLSQPQAVATAIIAAADKVR